MATINSKAFYGNIAQYINNPVLAHYKVLELLAEVHAGHDIDMDPSTPFIFALDATAVNTAAVIDQHAASMRQLNPVAATTQEDLYRHMSDKDYVGRFAMPASANFTFVIDILDLDGLLVEDEYTKIRQVTIPRNSYVQIAGYTFSLEYPISIRKYPNSGYTVLYLGGIHSPLTALSTNNIEYDIVTANNGLKYLKFQVPMKQFAIESQVTTVTYASGRYHSFEFSDQFVLARCYKQDPYTNMWEEIAVTHNQQVFDSTHPTVAVKVVNNTVRFEIPYVFIQNPEPTQQILGKVRFDVYTTKGAITVDLKAQPLENFTAVWHAVDESEWTNETKVLSEIRNMAVRSDDLVSGGRAAISFAELKSRVMANALGRQNLPITSAQTQTQLVDLGYKIHTHIDTVTDRVFHACKPSPNPIDSAMLTPASISIQTLGLRTDEVSQRPGVTQRGLITTLGSNTLYRVHAGALVLVGVDERNQLNASDPASRAWLVNERTYHYSPFYYVLDATGITFEVRTYHLDAPTVTSKTFDMENQTSRFQVSFTKSYHVRRYTERRDEMDATRGYVEGYILQFTTKSNAAFKELYSNSLLSTEDFSDIQERDRKHVSMQLSFKPTNKSKRVYVYATLVAVDVLTLERTYEFKMPTDFILDANDEIEWPEIDPGTDAQPVKTALTTRFDLFCVINAREDENYRRSYIDDVADLTVFPESHAVVWEMVDVQFGTPLKGLWSQSRSNVSSVSYQTHAQDIPLIYDDDVYEADQQTERYFRFDEDGKIINKKLYSRGEIVKIDGEVVYRHRKGDIVLDAQGLPIPTSEYKHQLTRYIDIYLIEGAYFFATEKITSDYRDYVRDITVKWITLELPQFQKQMLEKTSIYYYPECTSGPLTILSPNNAEEVIDSAQSLTLVLHVPQDVKVNAVMKTEFARHAVRIIYEKFKEEVVAVSEIERSLKAVYGDDVANIELLGVTGKTNYPLLTVLDKTKRLGIRKRLVAYPDGTLGVEEDVTVRFTTHGLVKESAFSRV